MRISDWSSDVCSSDLGSGPDLDDRHDESFRASLLLEPLEGMKNVTVYDYYNANEAGTGTILYNLYPNATSGGGNARIPALAPFFDCGTPINCDDIGRASCRERVFQYV